MTLSEEIQWRGFVSQTTLGSLKLLDEENKAFYMGFDASAPSQTVGNLAAMMFAKAFLRHGWKGVLLAGGSTSLIGDPGGKDAERPLQDEATIARNVSNAAEQIKRIMSGYEFKMVNNLDWTRDMRVIPFLRDIGKHFSMTPLIQRDYIAKRLGESGSGISYAEFSYTILQGMDYLHLYDTEGVTLQLGGSDQWGNCLSGVELIRKARGAQADAITLNLVINKATGKKFGKSEEGAIWLDATMTSVYKFFQFWLNADDAGVEGYLKIFTELDKGTVERVMAEFNADRGQRTAQKTLAYEVTKLVHGQDRADSAKRASDALFGAGDYTDLKAEDFAMLANEVPTIHCPAGTDFVAVLVSAGLAKSNSEARRYLQEKSVYVNGTQLPEGKETLAEDDVINGFTIIRRGRNSVALVRIGK